MKHLISFQYHNGQCGNKSGTLDEVIAHARANKTHWKSFSFFKVLPSDGLTSDLEPIETSL